MNVICATIQFVNRLIDYSMFRRISDFCMKHVVVSYGLVYSFRKIVWILFLNSYWTWIVWSHWVLYTDTRFVRTIQRQTDFDALGEKTSENGKNCLEHCVLSPFYPRFIPCVLSKIFVFDFNSEHDGDTDAIAWCFTGEQVRRFLSCVIVKQKNFNNTLIVCCFLKSNNSTSHLLVRIKCHRRIRPWHNVLAGETTRKLGENLEELFSIALAVIVALTLKTHHVLFVQKQW